MVIYIYAHYEHTPVFSFALQTSQSLKLKYMIMYNIQILTAYKWDSTKYIVGQIWTFPFHEATAE